MGSKINPGAFDCYENALPDEPMFVLLARDESAPNLVRDWADLRASRLANEGNVSAGGDPKVLEASKCAADMELWLHNNPRPADGYPKPVKIDLVDKTAETVTEEIHQLGLGVFTSKLLTAEEMKNIRKEVKAAVVRGIKKSADEIYFGRKG